MWTTTLSGLRSVTCSADGSWIVCSRANFAPIALPISHWALRGAGEFHAKPVSAIHITASETFLLTGSDDGSIFVWGFCNSCKCDLVFRVHTAPIASISSSSTEEIIVSADSKKLILLWERKTGTTLRTLDRSAGGSARFILDDYLLIQYHRGLKVVDIQGKVMSSSAHHVDGCYDILSDVPQVVRQKIIPPLGTPLTPEYSTFFPQGPGVNSSRLASSIIGVSRSNSDAGVHTVCLYTLNDLSSMIGKLSQGWIEDSFGDRETIEHTDRITSFSFLGSRPIPCGSPAILAPDHAYLAATGSEDLTVIVWNWPAAAPLAILQHTHFVSNVHFCYPSGGCRKAYSAEFLLELRDLDCTYRHLNDPNLICCLLTTQFVGVDHATLRVFEIRVRASGHEERTTAMTEGGLTSNDEEHAKFPYFGVFVEQSCQSEVIEGCSITCLVARSSDGLICLGHDRLNEVRFYRYVARQDLDAVIGATREEGRDSHAVEYCMKLAVVRRLSARL
jgi:hypothetical protein